jgi:hypothetical protein
MKARWGSGGIAPRILDFGTHYEVSGHLHAPAVLLARKVTLVLIGRAPEPVGMQREERNSQPLSGLEPPIVQLVVQCYTTELSRLLNQECKR